MTAKEYLQRPKQIVQEIRRKQGRIETLKRLATRLGPEMSDIRVQTTPDPTRMQGFLADAADEEREIARLEEKLQEALCDSARLIARLLDEKMARILEMRYLDKQMWEDICETMEAEMDTGRTRVFELHRIALDILTPAPETDDEENWQ
jgi:hypothetical protein